jgi:hypothetical protein
MAASRLKVNRITLPARRLYPIPSAVRPPPSARRAATGEIPPLSLVLGRARETSQRMDLARAARFSLYLLPMHIAVAHPHVRRTLAQSAEIDFQRTGAVQCPQRADAIAQPGEQNRKFRARCDGPRFSARSDLRNEPERVRRPPRADPDRAPVVPRRPPAPRGRRDPAAPCVPGWRGRVRVRFPDFQTAQRPREILEHRRPAVENVDIEAKLAAFRHGSAIQGAGAENERPRPVASPLGARPRSLPGSKRRAYAAGDAVSRKIRPKAPRITLPLLPAGKWTRPSARKWNRNRKNSNLLFKFRPDLLL